MGCNGLRKIGVADRKHRSLFQVSGEEKEPQTAEGERGGKVPDVRQSPSRKLRANHPEKVHQAHKDQPNGHGWQDFGIALKVAGEEQKERDKKVENDHDDGNHAPLAVQARIVERDFLRLIAGPNDKKLGKVEISPEHQESQKQLTHIVNVARLKNAGERAAAREQHYYSNHQGHGRDELAGYEQEAVDRGRPVG